MPHEKRVGNHQDTVACNRCDKTQALRPGHARTAIRVSVGFSHLPGETRPTRASDRTRLSGIYFLQDGPSRGQDQEAAYWRATPRPCPLEGRSIGPPGVHKRTQQVDGDEVLRHHAQPTAVIETSGQKPSCTRWAGDCRSTPRNLVRRHRASTKDYGRASCQSSLRTLGQHTGPRETLSTRSTKHELFQFRPINSTVIDNRCTGHPLTTDIALLHATFSEMKRFCGRNKNNRSRFTRLTINSSQH